jgi:hypothetical protein
MNKGNFRRCYYCGLKATSKEHAPPKQLFRYFDCDSITVPSCDAHNGKKSGRDQAIIHGFFISLLGYQRNLEPAVHKAILGAKNGFEYTKKAAVKACLIRNPPVNVQELPKIAYLTKENKIYDWIRQLSAAIIYDAINKYDPSIPWENLRIFSQNWVPAQSANGLDLDKTIELFKKQEKGKVELDDLIWQDGWSAHPKPYPQDIYRFRFHFGNESIVLRHIFCNRFYWHIWLPNNEHLKNSILKKIKSGWQSAKGDSI